MRVNGTWRWMDISDYVGINGDWVTCPIDMSLLRGGQENYFGLTTNVVSYGIHRQQRGLLRHARGGGLQQLPDE